MNNSPTEDVSQTLASHIANLTYDDLPGHVISATKLAILDTIAATIAGSNQPGILETLSTLIQWGGVQESSLAIWGQKLPAHEAVIANVAMAHALEIDDSHYPAIVHPTAPTPWAALATAEAKGGVSGKDLLLAVVAGVDLMVRMGLAAPRTLYLGYHTAMFSGSTGAGSQTLAQFNIPFTVAAAILWRDVFVAEVQAEAIIDPAVLDIAKRISVVANPTLSGGVAFVPVTVRIMLRDGTKLEHTAKSLKGSPETPMSWDEIVEERLLRSVRFSARPLSEAQIWLLQETVKALEDLTDSAQLLDILNGTKPTPLALKPPATPKTFATETAPSSGDSDAIVAPGNACRAHRLQ